jgi:hypothetical protein
MACDCICITPAVVYDRSLGQQEIQIIDNTVSMHRTAYLCLEENKKRSRYSSSLFYCVTSTLRLNVNKQFLRLFRFLFYCVAIVYCVAIGLLGRNSFMGLVIRSYIWPYYGSLYEPRIDVGGGK